MTGLFKKAPANGPVKIGPSVPVFVALLARWIDSAWDCSPSLPTLIDRLVIGVQLTAATLCLLVFFDLTREGRFVSEDSHHHHAALYLLLAASAALMIAGAVQFTRRGRRETVLRKSEERVTLAAQAASIGLWGWDRSKNRFWMTSTCLTALGLAPKTPLTLEGLLALIHLEDHAATRGAIAGALETGEAHECSFRQIRAGGEMRWFRLRVCANDSSGHRHLAGSIVDITERRLMETEMESQRRSLTHLSRVGMLGELGGALAHELKQPLTAILSNAQALQRLLDRSAIDMTEVRAVILDIIQDDSRATDVIQHLRSLLKPGDFHGSIIDLNEVVRATLKLVRNDLMVRRIAISTALHEKALPVMGNSVQLQQLLLNLIFNGAEAMADKPAGTMLITTDVMSGPAAHIALADTGPGLTPEIMKKLFEPFVSTKLHGLGLGLPISRAIAVSHQGHIWAQNNPGRGATFHVSVPLVGSE